MLRLIVGGFLIAHGLVHLAIWLPQALAAALPEGAPFDAGHSWLLSNAAGDGARLVAAGIAVIAAAGLAGAGAGYLAGQDWWRLLALGGAGASLALLFLYWNLWLSIAVLIDAAIIGYVVMFASSTAAEA